MKKLQGDKMSRPKGNARVKNIVVRMTEKEKAELDRKADALGQSISEYMRRAADEHYALATGQLKVIRD